MNEKTITIKITQSIYETVLCELIKYNLGIGESFDFGGLNYTINNSSDGEVSIVVENNSEYYIKDNYTELVKNINISKNNSIKVSNMVKPTTVYEIEVIEIKNEIPKAFM